VVSAPWPGNVRELANALERGAILAGDSVLTPSHLSPPTTPRSATGGTLAELEREAISRALAEVDGNRRRAAESLGIGLRTLYEKLKRHDLG
jgi:two-component system response regulator FlrC